MTAAYPTPATNHQQLLDCDGVYRNHSVYIYIMAKIKKIKGQHELTAKTRWK